MVNVFFEVHSGLPREGLGDTESIRKAYLMLSNLPENPRILDVGCGPCMQTITLAKLSNGRIDGVNNHQPFLERLKKNAKKKKGTYFIGCVSLSQLHMPVQNFLQRR